jgi:hypothetical protein
VRCRCQNFLHSPYSRCHFSQLVTDTYQRPHFFPIFEMAIQSRSPGFQTRFESALQAYEETTSIVLTQHPLAVNLQNCQSTDDITTILQGRSKARGDPRQRDRMMRAIKNSVSILDSLSDVVVLVRQTEARSTCSTFLTFHPILILTREGDTNWSWYIIRCTCRSLFHM